MPPIKVGLSELKRMYNSIPDKNDINLMLESNIQNLLLIRIGMGLSLREFSSILETSYVNVSEIERGKRKSISKPLMKRLIRKARPLPGFKEIERNYDRICSLSNGGQKQAMKRAEKASYTLSENILMKKLTKTGASFLSHQTINTSIGPVNVDFIIKTKGHDIIIEISDTVRRQKLESMSYRAYKIKKVIDCLMIAILPDNLTEALKKRLEDFDIILRFSDIEELDKTLQLTPQAAV